jgi:3'-phosphoadenosine 5'-phosphosulfate sulfotransferase (PAPS reductase)/FAD synthetase
MYILSSSGGNDSIALIQYAREYRFKDVHVVYCNTGWAHSNWPERIARMKALCERYAMTFVELTSVGFEKLVMEEKQYWPSGAGSGQQFCTTFLKKLPINRYMDKVDPDGEAVVLTGIRREESAHRAQWPEWSQSEDSNGGRDVWCPLVRHTESLRNALIHRAKFEVLPYRSRECYPCVNSSRADLRALEPEAVARIKAMEEKLGSTMFRPHKFMGAQGIEQVVVWANSERGKYMKPAPACDSGFCGD